MHRELKGATWKLDISCIAILKPQLGRGGGARISCFAYPAKFAKFCVRELRKLIFAPTFAEVLIDKQSFRKNLKDDD